MIPKLVTAPAVLIVLAPVAMTPKAPNRRSAFASTLTEGGFAAACCAGYRPSIATPRQARALPGEHHAAGSPWACPISQEINFMLEARPTRRNGDPMSAQAGQGKRTKRNAGVHVE